MTSEPVGGLRILVVPAKPWPCDHPMLETVFAKILPARGHRVEWVMWTDRTDGVDATWHDSLVHLTPLRTGSAVAVVNRWLRLLMRMYRIARSERFDMIQVRNSSAAGLAAIAIRRATGIPFAFQASFPVAEWTTEAARRGDVRAPALRRIAAGLQRALRTSLIRRADLVLAISDRMRDDLVRDGAAANRIVVFPLGTDDPPEPDTGAVRSLRSELGLGDGLLILYVGSISPQRELAFLVHVAAIVAERHPAARWMLVGPSSNGEDELLRREVARAGLADRFDIHRAVPRTEVPSFLALSSLTVSPIPPVPIYLVSSPSKTVESLAAGRPVVATAIPDQQTVVRESGGGVIAPYRPDAFADAISALLDNPQQRAAMGAAGRDWVREHRSYEGLATLLEHAYVEAIRKRR